MNIVYLFILGVIIECNKSFSNPISSVNQEYLRDGYFYERPKLHLGNYNQENSQIKFNESTLSYPHLVSSESDLPSFDVRHLSSEQENKEINQTFNFNQSTSNTEIPKTIVTKLSAEQLLNQRYDKLRLQAEKKQPQVPEEMMSVIGTAIVPKLTAEELINRLYDMRSGRPSISQTQEEIGIDSSDNTTTTSTELPLVGISPLAIRTLAG